MILSDFQRHKSKWYRSFLKGYRTYFTYGVIYRMIPVIEAFGLQNQLQSSSDKIYVYTNVRDKWQC